MTDTPAPVMPRTEAGRRLLDIIAPGRSDGWRAEDILAIEREAAGPAATEALRSALERLVAVIDSASMLWRDPVPADAIAAIHNAKEVLASPEPTPEARFNALHDAAGCCRPTPDSGLDVERLRPPVEAGIREWWNDIAREDHAVGINLSDPTYRRKAFADLAARLSSTDSPEEPA